MIIFLVTLSFLIFDVILTKITTAVDFPNLLSDPEEILPR
jgi:hypothetical protein